MATPAISRSGRVLKKSVRLLEMESDTKTQRALPKTSKSLTESSLIDNVTSPQTSNIIKSPTNIKIKLNFSGDNLANTGDVQESKSIPINNVTVSKLIKTSPTKIPIQVVRGPINSNSLIFKMKSDENENSVVSLKRPLDTVDNLNIVKKPKIIVANNIQANIKNVEDNIGQTIKDEQPFKTILSPIIQVDKDTKAKIQQSFVSSTPKINTIISSKLILARSIQEQRRINQANRAKLLVQQQSLQPSPSNVPNNTTHNQSSNVDEDSNNETIKRKKPSISAYVLWCKENRSQIQSNYPELDFANLSRKMGEIWHTLPQTEKATWFRKAQLIAKHGSVANNGSSFNSLFFNDNDLKPKFVSGNSTLPITVDTLQTYDDNFINGDNDPVYEGEAHHIGTELIDIQAYLSILGDSLMTLGSYLQRGVKYNSEMDYSPSAALSTLLDTALVAMGSLSGLTRSIPQIAPSSESLAKTIENITYFMPPSELN